MDSTEDIREFLATRRARITPQQVGLPVYGRRRVPGLRREEVAALAGVSVDYYARLERGNLTGVSDSVLEAIARALQLDEAEHTYLYDLARAANPTPRTRRRPTRGPRISPSVQRVLAGMTDVPAIIRNGRLDILGASQLGYALYSPLYDDPRRPANFARFAFLDPQAHDFYPDWEDSANVSVTLLRTEAARNPRDRGLPTSSVNCRPAAGISVNAGRPTTFDYTEPGPSSSITPLSGTSRSPTTTCSCRHPSD
nr:helix-turn-helix family protein [Rhodococcus sp. JVH1]